MVLRSSRPLAPAALRNLPFIRAGVARGLSTTALSTALQSAGRGVRRTDLLAAVRRVRGIETAGINLRGVRRDRMPDPARIPTALTKIRRKFSFQVRIDGIDPRDNSPTQRNITITSDTILTRAQLADDAQDLVDQDPQRYPIEITNVVLISAVQRA